MIGLAYKTKMIKIVVILVMQQFILGIDLQDCTHHHIAIACALLESGLSKSDSSYANLAKKKLK